MSTRRRYVATLDIGSGSGRCLIFDLDGQLVASAQQEWRPKSVPGIPGAQDFDVAEAWQVLTWAVRAALDRAGVGGSDVAAVTVTSMREGIVLYDDDLRVIWACPNTDGRAINEAAEMVERGLARRIYDVGGDWVSIIAPPRLWWIRRHQPALYGRIRQLSMLSDWGVYKLCGRVVTDVSCGSSSGMFDLARRTWCEETISALDLPRGIYPEVVEAGTVVGSVAAEAARETGLQAGTPVVASGADTQLALAGVGAIQPNNYAVIGGTFWQTAVTADRPLIDPQARLRTHCHALPGRWMPEGIGFYIGFATRWFRDAFCQEEKRAALKQGLDPYYALETMAADAPAGSNGVLAIFSNAMNAKRWKHAAPSFMQFDLLSPETSGKKECYRALEESAAYVSYGNYLVLQELTGVPAESIVFGGGGAKGFLWPQILSDVYGLPVKVPLIKESTSLGAAMWALTAIGRWPGLERAAEDVVRWERTFQPDWRNHETYRGIFRRWRAVYARSLQMVDAGLLRPMWAAPGT